MPRNIFFLASIENLKSLALTVFLPHKGLRQPISRRHCCANPQMGSGPLQLIISTRTNLMTGWMRWIASGENATLLRGERERLMIRMSSVEGNASGNYWWRPNQLGRGNNDS